MSRSSDAGKGPERRKGENPRAFDKGYDRIRWPKKQPTNPKDTTSKQRKTR